MTTRNISNLLRQSLLQATTFDKGNHKYIYHPISDGIPRLRPDLLEEVTLGLSQILKWQEAEVIITVEAMGLPVATALSLRTGIPLAVVRKRAYGVAGEIVVEQKTGYGGSKLYINGVKSGDKVLLVDCVVSTGGTLIPILTALKNSGVDVRDVGCVYGKQGGKENVLAATGFHVKTLMDVRVGEDGIVREIL